MWQSLAPQSIRQLGIFCAAVLVAFQVVAAEDRDAGAKVRKLALLVGVGKYEHLPAAEQLDGCANDVAAMRQLLEGRFGFAPADVVTLTDQQATGAAIRTAFKKLADQVGKLPQDQPIQVLFHFSGHGSQAVDQPEGDPDCDEPDGLDETLVPYDALSQGGEQDLRDDELNTFAEAVAAHPQARLCIVLDCCHSGSGARGTTKLRRLSRGLRALPDDVPADRKIREKLLPERTVMLSACRAQEVEPEYQDGDKTYGLFTRFLVQSLTQSRNVSTLNYEQLRQSVVHGYHGSAGIPQSPLPQLEGKPADLRLSVLGAAMQNDLPPYWTVEPIPTDPTRARLAAGTFHGVTIGSIYEIVPAESAHTRDVSQPSQSDAMLLAIEKVDGAGAVGKLQRSSADGPRPARWPRELKAAVGFERFHEVGDAGLRLAVIRVAADGVDGPRLGQDAAKLDLVRRAVELAQRKNESPWLEWIGDDGPVDVVLRIHGQQAALFPATGVTLREDVALSVKDSGALNPLRGGWGPIDLSDDAAAGKTAEYLRRISLTRNLIRLAAAQAAAKAPSAAGAVQLELVHVEVDPQAGIVDTGAWQPGDAGALAMQAGDYYALRLTNPAKAKAMVYATVLVIGPNLDVQIAFPKQAGVGIVDEQSLAPGQARLSDGFACDDVLGERWAIVLATAKPHDLTYVAQDELPTVRGGASDFDRFLQGYTVKRTRGDQRLGAAAAPVVWSAGLLRWEARP